MDVYQLRDNLKNTIKNKRELLVDISDDSSDDLVAQFLNINIDELERILVDVEICCEQSTRESRDPTQLQSAGVRSDAKRENLLNFL